MIAVFLALGLGILMGSVVLSDRYVARLENRVKAIEEQSDARRQEIALLNERLDVLQEFSTETEPRLLDGVLLGEEVVIVELPRTDGTLRDALTEAVAGAGGEVVSTLLLTERFALEEEGARTELSTILGTASSEPADLRLQAARALGQRLAGAAARVETTRGGFSTQRLASLTQALHDADFIDVAEDGDALVPSGAAFLVLGGASAESTDGTIPMSLELASSLSTRGRVVVVVEASESVWQLVDSIREDADLGAAVSTVDAGESVPGRVAVVLGLDLASEGITGHYGSGDGATAIVPPATPDG